MNETMRILKQLFAAYPQAQVSEQTVAVYLRMLRDIPPEALQVAVDQAIATSKFLPTVAELRDTLHGLRQLDTPSWGEAWEDVMSEMRRIGSYGVPQFRSRLTEQVVRSMGWKTLCASENPQTDRAQFRDMWNALAARQERTDKLLPGVREWAAQNNGPARLGDLVAGLLATNGDNRQ